ncbi:MAG: hypothetical protein RL112_2208 [Planctomycetota bacterium]|jgi:hypothetical protein
MMKLLSTAAVGLALAATAQANSIDRAGSLLVFPYFSNTSGSTTFLTVTNSNADAAGTIDVEFVYINGDDCLEFNRTRRLTPNDTITVSTNLDNPNDRRGYVYAFAKSTTTGAAVSFNFLEGNSIVVNFAEALSTNIAPVVYAAVPAQGANTDVDGDGNRDMNGAEYVSSANEIHIPRFVASSDSSLIVLGLTGAQFRTVISFLAYNDNEEAFSGQFTVDCWDIKRLQNISGVFTDGFLESTNHNVGETGISQLETGWIRLVGQTAFSTAAQRSNPAFIAVSIDLAFYSSLPYGAGTNNNGDLLVLGPFADNN